MNTAYLTKIDEAIKSVERWYSNTSLMHEGNDMFANDEILEKKNTRFAMWYFGEGQLFSSFESFKKIENYYTETYDAFFQFYELYNKPFKKGFFSNNSKRKKELDDLLLIVQEKSKMLIKTTYFFRSKLSSSPLFNQKTKNKNDSLTFDKEEIQHLSTKVERKNSDSKVDYEKKLNAEIAKVKEQLEKDYNDKLKTTLHEEKQSEKKSNETTQSIDDKDIDLDDEIRRILS